MSERTGDIVYTPAWWPAGVDVDVVRVEEPHQFDCDNLDCPTCTPIANANFVAAIESMR